jgi:hypothetical protein
MNNINDKKDLHKFEHKPGTGSLFKNKFKKTIKQPDINGQIKLSRSYEAGELIKFSGWLHESPNNKYYSLSENNYSAQLDLFDYLEIENKE